MRQASMTAITHAVITTGKYMAYAMLAASLLVVALAQSSFAESGGIGGRPSNPDPANNRSQSIFIKEIKPGAIANDSVDVINNDDTEKTILVYATDSAKSSGGAFACAQAVDAKTGVGSWIALEQTTVTVAAHSTVKVPFTITSPANAEPGELDGCIVLQEQKEATQQGGIALSFRTAIRVATFTPGNIIKNIDTLGIDVRQANESVTLSPSVKNTGNVSLDTKVTTAIKSLFGTTIASKDNTFPTLRDQVTQWNIAMDKPFWGGLYSASYAISYDASDNHIGETKDDTQKTIQGQSVYFVAAPSPVAALIELAVLIGIVIGIVKYFAYRIHKKTVDEKWVDHTIIEVEQLQDVAARHGISWKLLAKANKLKAPYSLPIGTTIKVPHLQKKLQKNGRRKK